MGLCACPIEGTKKVLSSDVFHSVRDVFRCTSVLFLANDRLLSDEAFLYELSKNGIKVLVAFPCKKICGALERIEEYKPQKS